MLCLAEDDVDKKEGEGRGSCWSVISLHTHTHTHTMGLTQAQRWRELRRAACRQCQNGEGGGGNRRTEERMQRGRRVRGLLVNRQESKPERRGMRADGREAMLEKALQAGMMMSPLNYLLEPRALAHPRCILQAVASAAEAAEAAGVGAAT
jgi:hypothetical protein